MADQSQIGRRTFSGKQPHLILGGCGQADIVFIVDSSGSINFIDDQNWSQVLKFLSEFIQKETVSQDVRFSLITYNETASLIFDLRRYTSQAAASDAVMRTPYLDGETNIAAALLLATNTVFTEVRGDRPSANNIAILISDGVATVDKDQTAPAAVLLKEKAFVTSVGVSDKINATELASISSNNIVYTVADFNKLNSVLEDVVNDACRITQAPVGESLIQWLYQYQSTSI